MANPPQTIVGLGSIVSPSSAALLWVADPNANPQDRSFNLANLLAYLVVAGRLPASLGLPAPVLLSSGSPYTAAALTGSITYFICVRPASGYRKQFQTQGSQHHWSCNRTGEDRTLYWESNCTTCGKRRLLFAKC